MFRKIILAAFVLSCTTAFADDSPSLRQVYEAAQAGRLDDALTGDDTMSMIIECALTCIWL